MSAVNHVYPILSKAHIFFLYSASEKNFLLKKLAVRLINLRKIVKNRTCLDNFRKYRVSKFQFIYNIIYTST